MYFPLLVFFVISSALHNSSYFEKETKAQAGNCSFPVVEIQTGCNPLISSCINAWLDICSAQNPPQQGLVPHPSDSSSLEVNNEHRGQGSLAVRPMQKVDQAHPALLPQLWLLVGRYCRSELCSPSSQCSSLGPKLGLGCMGGCFSLETSNSETKKLLKQEAWQGKGEREGTVQRKGQARCGGEHTAITLSLCSSQLGHARPTNTISCNSVDAAHRSNARCSCGTGCGSHCSDQTCLPGLYSYAERSPRSIGSFGTGGEQAGDSRPAPRDCKSRPCPESSPRAGGIQREAPPALVPTSSGVAENVERPNGWLRYSTRAISSSHPKGQSGHGSGPSQHTDSQRKSCWETSTRPHCGCQDRRSWSTGRSGPGGTCYAENIAQFGGSVRPQGMWQSTHISGHGARERDYHGGLRGRQSRWSKAASLCLAIWWSNQTHPGFNNYHWIECPGTSMAETYGETRHTRWEVISGSAPTCLRNAERLPSKRRGPVRFTGVEAYPSVCDRLGAACPDVRHYKDLFSQVDDNFTMDVPLDDFLLPYEAQRQAAQHHWTCCLTDLFDGISPDVQSSYLRNSELMTIAQHDTLVDLSAPLADEDSDVRTCPVVHAQKDVHIVTSSSSRSPFHHDLLPHVSDRWCAIDCPVIEVDPSDAPDDDIQESRKPKHLEWSFPTNIRRTLSDELYQCLSDDEATAITKFVTENSHLTTVTIRTYGFQDFPRGQRDLRVPLHRLIHWKGFAADTWRDVIRPDDLLTIIVAPQPNDPGIDLHAIVTSTSHLLDKLVLLQIHPEEVAPIRTVVECTETSTGYTLLRKAGHDIDMGADYNFRLDGKLYYGFEILPIERGHYWTVRISSSADALYMQQLSAKRIHPMTWRTWPEVNEDLARILRENEEERLLAGDQTVIGPTTFDDHDEWIRIAQETENGMNTPVTITVFGLKDVDIGTRRITIASINYRSIEDAILGLWPQFDALAKKIHLVYPKPLETDISHVDVILEFYDLWNPLDDFWKPILQECLQPELDTIVRTANYCPGHVSKENFPLYETGCPGATEDIDMQVWVRGWPLPHPRTMGVVPGDLIQIRHSDRTIQVEEWIQRFFPQANIFKRNMIDQTANIARRDTTWTFLGQVCPGEPAHVDVLYPQWLRYHDPYFVVQALLEILTYRGLSYQDKVIFPTLNRNATNVTFLFGTPQESQSLVQVTYSAKWNETWSEQFCYMTRSDQTTHEFLRSVNSLGYDAEILHNGRLHEGDQIHLTNGDVLEIELQDESDDEDSSANDSSSLMQRPKPSTAPGLTRTHIAGIHLPLAEIAIDTEIPLLENVAEFWPYPHVPPSSVVALHPVSDPPNFAHAEPLPLLVVQRNEDRFDQEMESDVLAVVTVSVQAPHAGQPRSQRFKILWVPFKGTRSNFIDFFRMTGHCRKADVICFLYLNNIIWPESDMALRRIESGDHLRLQVRTEGNSWCDFEYSEGISRSRKLFASSSPEREPEERGGQEDEQEEEEEAARSPPSDYTIRSDHRGRQRRSRSRARRRRDDREDDSPTLLQQSLELHVKLRKKLSSVSLPHEGKSHVSDLWCTQPCGVLTDLGNSSSMRTPLGDITNDPQYWNDTEACDIDRNQLGSRISLVDRTVQSKPMKQKIELDSLLFPVSSTKLVCIATPDHDLLLPSQIEMIDNFDGDCIDTELAAWGHFGLRHTLLPRFCCQRDIVVVERSVTGKSAHLLFVDESTEDFWWHNLPERSIDLCDEVALMKILCHHGHSRAVILNQSVLSSRVSWILYADVSHKTQEAPAANWHGLTIPRVHQHDEAHTFETLIKTCNGTGTPCLLKAAAPDIVSQLFQTSDCLRSIFDDIPVPEACRQAVQQCIPAHGPFDRLRIYTDGSSNPAFRHWEPELVLRDGTPDAWAFLVLGEYYGSSEHDSDFTFLGYATHPVCYEPDLPHYAGATRIGSDVAEREALLWAGLWRMAYNLDTPTVFVTDSVTAGHFAFGECGAAAPDEGHRLTRGTYQALATALPGDRLQWHHVAGHCGEVWNECCDALAKWSSSTVHWMKRQQIDLRQWKLIIPNLWWYFNTAEHGLPPLHKDGYFCTPPPALPDLVAQADEPRPVDIPREIAISVSLVSANVQTLGKGPDGHAGKLDYIQQQFVEHGVCVAGIQEARTDESFATKQGSFIRLASGSDRGHHGVELWLSKTQPFGYDRGAPCYFRAQDVIVLHSDPRRLLVRVTHPSLEVLLLVLHAPQSGRDHEERKEWWLTTNDLVTRFAHLAPLFVMGDMNATTGPADCLHCHHDDLTTPNTEFLRTFAETASLAFPATTDLHQGEKYTWTSPDGSLRRCIDHVMVPLSFLSYCTHSTVLEQIDLGTGHEDHRAVGVQLGWTFYTSRGSHQMKVNTIPREHIKTNMEIRQALGTVVIPAWDCDIEKQVTQCNGAIHRIIQVSAQPTRSKPKKHFISDEIWEHRREKNRCKHTIGFIDTARRREDLRVFIKAWKGICHSTSDVQPLTFPSGYSCLLSCFRLKHGSRIALLARRIKEHLKSYKKAFVEQTIAQVPDNACASQILTLMKPCIGTSNSRKRSRPSLPHVLDAEGNPCLSVDDARNRWIEFFAAMEGGNRISTEEQRTLWIQNLASFRAESFEHDITLLPSLFDLETAFRRVRQGKAMGDDAVPPEICGGHPVQMAKMTYPQLLKLALHGQEALTHKGGRLAIAHKKGPTNVCGSYRSLLISSHLGKSLHRALRQNQQSIYTQYMQKQQVGGRPKIPVNFAVHMVRAHLRACADRGISGGLVFLDLTEAFYRVLRPLALGGNWNDEILASMALRLHLDPDTLHDLHERLREPDALSRAQTPVFHRKYLQALHTDTHFRMDHQEDQVRTTFGSRPGDSFADVVFGFLWARVLKLIEEQMDEHCLLSWVPQLKYCGLHAPRTGQQRSYLGPTWCDDLCICLSDQNPLELEQKTKVTLSIVLDLCKEHGMTPNLKPGKTEVLFSLRGCGSRKLRRKYYGNQGRGQLQVVGEHSMYNVGVVGEYKHLGGLVHASGDTRKELRRRLSMAHATFTKFRRLLFHNKSFAMQKRATLFQTLVMSQFLYGIETWVVEDKASRNYLHAGITRLYRRLLGARHDEHLSDAEILSRCGLPSPSTLLRRARLRYLGMLYCSGPPEIWPILLQDRPWLDLTLDDIQWLWKQLHNCSPLCDPDQDFSHWEFLMRDHPRYWKRLVARGVQHEILQQQHAHLVHTRSERIVAALNSFGQLNQEVTVPCRRRATQQDASSYGCLFCEISCKTKAGEAVHMNRRHGVPSRLRFLYSESSCPHCLREYHLPERVHQHLRTNKKCRNALARRKRSAILAVGSGSRAHAAFEEKHNRLTPYQIGAGPHLPSVPEGESSEDDLVDGTEAVDQGLVTRICDCFQQYSDLPDPLLLAELRAAIRQQPVSWTSYISTLDAIDSMLTDLDSDPLPDELMRYPALREFLRSTEFWPFLTKSFASGEDLETGCWERYIYDLLHHQGLFWKRTHPVKRFGRERYLLHFFSGRRRAGDVQFYLDQRVFEGMTVHTVSIDIIVDASLGDLMRAEAQAWWRDAIAAGYVIGLLGGPPCETWSRARGVELSGKKGPRILRTPDEPWGLSSLGLRELRQLIFGSTLLLFMLETFAMVTVAGGAALLEHPAEPDESTLVSIWRLVLVAALEELPGVTRHRLKQGCMGSESSKPTDLLCANLHTLPRRLKECQLRSGPMHASSIGMNADGTFKTGKLKEYPPALNRAIALAFSDAISGIDCAAEVAVPTDFHERCQRLICSEFGAHYGPDFAGAIG